MTSPSLVAVAHGSRDPRSPAAVAALVDAVRNRRPELDVRLAFLDLAVPRVEPVLAQLPRAVVVPLLLGRAYHATVDVPGAVAAAGRSGRDVDVAGVLGPDPRLEQVALERLAAAGVTPDDTDTAVVLAAAGSAHAQANAEVAAVAARWARSTHWAAVVPAFTCAASPTVTHAVARLRALGARRVAIASWFLAPGLLPDKVERLARECGADTVAEVLGAHAAIAAVIGDRYDAARTCSAA